MDLDEEMAGIHVSALYYYPVKSCAGIALDVAELGPRGILHDREFMIIDASRWFLTQREEPRLALIQARRIGSSLELCAPEMETLAIHVQDLPRFEARIWNDRVMVADQGGRAADWLSTYVGQDCRLVRLPDDIVRPVNPSYAADKNDQVSLADGFPFLLTSELSLADLNSRLEYPLPMNRFRPNIVVDGAELPYIEDTWGEIQIGNIAFSVVKACARCVTTTTDQTTAARGREPLAMLATYRRVDRGVLFGQNLVHRTGGQIAVGDGVQVRALHPAPMFIQ